MSQLGIINYIHSTKKTSEKTFLSVRENIKKKAIMKICIKPPGDKNNMSAQRRKLNKKNEKNKLKE